MAVTPSMAAAPRVRVVLVITLAERGGAQMHVLELVRGLRDHVEYTVVVGEEGFLTAELRVLGVDVRVLPSLQRSVSARADVRGLLALRRILREARPRLVHTHSSKAGILGRIAARLEGIPAIHTAHAWSFSDGLSWQRKAASIPLEAAVGRVTDRFIVVSDADREVATRYHVARERQVRVVYNGVPDVVERAEPGRDERPVLTMVARLAAPKDPLLLLQALQAITLPCRVQLVGDGPDRAAIEANLRSTPPPPGVEVVLLGTRGDIPALLAASHVGLLVSRQEGFPLVVLEAMRAGLPVVASNVGGIREAVDDGVTGSLVDRGDADGLAAAIRALVGSPALRGRMGAAGRSAYETRFTIQRTLAATMDVYRELIREAP